MDLQYELVKTKSCLSLASSGTYLDHTLVMCVLLLHLAKSDGTSLFISLHFTQNVIHIMRWCNHHGMII
jgi:hypothetical protein